MLRLVRLSARPDAQPSESLTSPQTTALPSWLVVAVALTAALPSLLWALSGSALIHDDWMIAAGVEFAGFWDTLVTRSTESPARPLSALYFALTYGMFGTHVLPHVLLLALLNGAAAAIFLRLTSRLLGRDLAVWVTLAWVALPNRGSTRLWVAMGPAVVAVCLLLLAVLLLLDDRPIAAGLAAGSGVLAYEAVAALGLAAMVVWAWRHRPGTIRAAISGAAPVVLATAVIFLLSPKRSPDAHAPFSNAERLVPAQFGTAVFGPLGRLGGMIVLLAIAVAVARLALPSFRSSAGDRDRIVLSGMAILGLGAGPFLVAGFPFATDGLVDRGNVAAGLGTAVVLGGILWWIASCLRVTGVLLALAAVAYMGALNRVDLRDYRAAVRDGEVLQARVAADVPQFEVPLIVGPLLPNHGGVAQFINYGDLQSALRLAREDPDLEARIALTDSDFATANEPLRYDWRRRELVRR